MPQVYVIPKNRVKQVEKRFWEFFTFFNPEIDQVGDTVLSFEEGQTLKEEFKWIKDQNLKEHNPRQEEFSPSQLGPDLWIDARELSAYNLGNVNRVNSYTGLGKDAVVFNQNTNNRRPRVDSEVTPTEIRFRNGATPDFLRNSANVADFHSMKRGVILFINDTTSNAHFSIGDNTVANSEMRVGVNGGKAELSFNGGTEVFQSTKNVVNNDIIEWYKNGGEIKVRINGRRDTVVEVLGANTGQWINSIPTANQMAIGKNASSTATYWNTDLKELFIRSRPLKKDEREDYIDYLMERHSL